MMFDQENDPCRIRNSGRDRGTIDNKSALSALGGSWLDQAMGSDRSEIQRSLKTIGGVSYIASVHVQIIGCVDTYCCAGDCSRAHHLPHPT